jgi:putative inorganic carbon (hco3(-)) transporter
MFPLILLYLVLTIVRPQDFVPALVGVPVLPVVLVLAFLSWLASNAKTFAAPQFAILPAFLLVLMISQATNGWTGGMIDQLGKFGPTVISFFILAAACTSQRHVVTSMAMIALCSFVLALHGVQQSINGVGWTGIPVGEDGRIQYVGIFNDPNDLGLLFVAAVPMAVYLGRRGGAIGKFFWYAGTLLLLYGIRLTNSRGALLAVLVMAGFYVWYRRGILVASLLGGVGLACMKLLSSRMQELDAGEESANGRVDAWYSGLHMFMSHPLFGVGAGNFTEYNELTAHNSFVLVLAEAGFVGYVLWLAFVCYSFYMMWLLVRYQPDAVQAPEDYAQWQTERPLALTLLISLCGMFTTAFFLSRSYMIVLYLILALVVGNYVGARKRLPGMPTIYMTRGWWRWVPAAMGSVVGLYVLVAILLRTA